MHTSPLERAIQSAGFDDNDVDMATSGLCATFALSMNAVRPDLGMALLCCAHADGSPILCEDGDPSWRHVVILENDQLLDIDGVVRLDQAIENYCWGHLGSGTGCLVPISRADLILLVHADRKSFDARYFARWTAMLRSSLRAPITPDNEPVYA